VKDQKCLVTHHIRMRISEKTIEQMTQLSPRIVYNKDYAINKLEVVPTSSIVRDFKFVERQQIIRIF
jgi:hypothetical protein